MKNNTLKESLSVPGLEKNIVGVTLLKNDGYSVDIYTGEAIFGLTEIPEKYLQMEVLYVTGAAGEIVNIVIED